MKSVWCRKRAAPTPMAGAWLRSQRILALAYDALQPSPSPCARAAALRRRACAPARPSLYMRPGPSGTQCASTGTIVPEVASTQAPPTPRGSPPAAERRRSASRTALLAASHQRAASCSRPPAPTTDGAGSGANAWAWIAPSRSTTSARAPEVPRSIPSTYVEATGRSVSRRAIPARLSAGGRGWPPARFPRSARRRAAPTSSVRPTPTEPCSARSAARSAGSRNSATMSSGRCAPPPGPVGTIGMRFSLSRECTVGRASG